MPYAWLKVVGDEDSIPEGGAPMALLDPTFRAIQMQQKLNIKVLAGSYTVLAEDCGKVLLCTAAGTVTLPTPPASRAWDGFFIDVYVNADVAVVFATQTVDTLVTFNDIAADSVAYSTASEQIGAASRFFVWDTKWHHIPMVNEAATVVVAT